MWGARSLYPAGQVDTEEELVIAAIVIAAVLTAATWTYVDARSLGAADSHETGFTNFGPGGWCAAVLVLWPITFPLYLSERRGIRAAAQRSDEEPSDLVDAEQWRRWSVTWLVAMAALVGVAVLVTLDVFGGSDSLYCRSIWNGAPGADASFGWWPFGPTCTWLFRTQEPGVFWNALFLYGLATGVLLGVAALRRRRGAAASDD
jgi:hypothetical protein